MFTKAKIKQLNSATIEDVLGYQGKFEVIHRDYLVMLDPNQSDT